MTVQIQLRRDTSANWASANPVLAAGEIALSTDTQTIKVGNGTSTWSALPTSTLTLAHLAYSGLDQGADLIFGSGAATTGILNPSSSTNSTVIQANSADTLGVSRVDLSTNALSGISTAGAVSGDLLRYNTSNSRWEPITYSNFLTTVGQKTVQNIAFRQAGYFSQGGSTTVYRYAFPADTVTTTTAAPASMTNHSGFSNPSVAGYFCRGNATTTTYKFAFPADTVATTTSAPATLTSNGGFANPSVAGYFSQGGSFTTGVYKWTFPADTVSTTTASPNSGGNQAGFANPAVAGYLSKGLGYPMVSKYVFPTDTASSTTSAPNSMNFHSGFANPAVAGYFSKGSSTLVYKWTFPSDAVSTLTSETTSNLFAHGGFANGGVAGYFNQGNAQTVVWKYAFPSDTLSTTTASPGNMDSNAGFANS